MKITHRRDYREARRAEYPALGDQLDLLYRYFSTLPDLPPPLQDWVDQCQAVKTRYPKPEQ